MKNLLFKFEKYLNEPVPNITIVLFRIIFASILLIQTYYFISTNFIDNNIIKPLITFPFINGLDPTSKQNLIVIGYIMLISNFGMLYNKISRICTFIFLCCFTYFWLLDKGYFNNHYYFISLICFLLCLSDQSASFSKNIYTPRVYIFSLQVIVFIVYFIAGINKLNPYWLFDFQPMTHILEIKSEITNNSIFKNQSIIFLASYFGLFFDLFIGFLLFFKKSRIIAFILALVFHLGNYYLFRDVGEIGVFPFLMISTLVLFFEPKKINQIFQLHTEPQTILKKHLFFNKFIVLFLIIQIILPFRHIFFHGNVDYNGVGQRFSWRMKIMYKESEFQYFIINKMTNEKYAVDVSTMLTSKQYNNLKYFPDLIVPLAKRIKLEADEKFGIKNAKITCEYKTRFMGKNEQLLFSPELDLSKIKRNTLTNKWLWKLKK